jgi:hypothetical protein
MISQNVKAMSELECSECGNATPTTIGLNDVLCGRDKNAFNNIGNRRFRIIVSLSLNSYVNEAKTRKEKSRVIRNIIESTKACGGRFLQYRDGVLEELSERETHDKVGHAIRDMANAREKGDYSSVALYSDNQQQHQTQRKTKSRQQTCDDLVANKTQTRHDTPPLTISVEPINAYEPEHNICSQDDLFDYEYVSLHEFNWETPCSVINDCKDVKYQPDCNVDSLSLAFSQRLSMDTVSSFDFCRRGSINTISTTTRRGSVNSIYLMNDSMSFMDSRRGSMDMVTCARRGSINPMNCSRHGSMNMMNCSRRGSMNTFSSEALDYLIESMIEA